MKRCEGKWPVVGRPLITTNANVSARQRFEADCNLVSDYNQNSSRPCRGCSHQVSGGCMHTCKVSQADGAEPQNAWIFAVHWRFPNPPLEFQP